MIIFMQIITIIIHIIILMMIITAIIVVSFIIRASMFIILNSNIIINCFCVSHSALKSDRGVLVLPAHRLGIWGFNKIRECFPAIAVVISISVYIYES